jgi:hypothetical protein
MEEVIVDYINSHLILEGEINVKFCGRDMYYEDVEAHLMKVFNISKWTAEGYLVYCIFELNPDFYFMFWRNREKPPEPEWVVHGPNGRLVGGVDPAHDDAIDAMSVMLYRIWENGIVEIVNPARDLGR